MMKYDVFISSKSNDYEIAEEVCNFLKEKGLNVFFSKRSIDEEGDSRYEKVIADALRDSANMIVVCSDANHVRDDRGAKGSKWVYYEWSTFHQMILDNEKPEYTDIVTIYTSDADLKDLPRRLRSRQCIPYGEYKARIMRYMDDNVRSQDDSDEDFEPLAFGNAVEEKLDKKPFWKRMLLPLLTGLIGLVLGSGLVHMCKRQGSPLTLGNNNNHKTLVLAGGGSVVTFLDDKYRGILNEDTLVNVFSDNKYPNAIYLHMPSGVALTLLAEEAIMPYSRVNQPFYPVCFSAEKAVDSLFTTKCTRDQLLAAGHIVEYKLGDEKLAVYVEKSALGLNTIVDSTANEISVRQLIQLIGSGGSTIFSTSDGSGTYLAYNTELLKYNVDLKNIKYEKFSNQSDLSLLQAPNGAQETKPYVIMGGDIYRPEVLTDLIGKSVRKLMLVDDEGNSITRPLYIYFLAYSKMDERKVEHFIVPDEVLKLLRDLDFKNTKQLIDDKNQLTIEDTKQIIVPIE